MLTRTSIDRATLPMSLLSLAKSHLRAKEFDDDDQIIVQKLGAAIGTFERLTGFGVFRSVWEWTPGYEDSVGYARGSNWCWEGMNRCTGNLSSATFPAGEGSAYVLPVMRVTSFTAVDENDVSFTSSFEINGMSVSDIISDQYLLQTAAIPDGTVGLVLNLNTGFVTANEIPADMLEVFFQIMSDSFEFREAHQIPGVDRAPYSNSLVSRWWVPRC